jgi:hypothetical protein
MTRTGIRPLCPNPGSFALTLIRGAITTRLLDLKRTRGVTLITRHVNNSTAITSAVKSCSAPQDVSTKEEGPWAFRSSWRSLW